MTRHCECLSAFVPVQGAVWRTQRTAQRVTQVATGEGGVREFLKIVREMQRNAGGRTCVGHRRLLPQRGVDRRSSRGSGAAPTRYPASARRCSERPRFCGHCLLTQRGNAGAPPGVSEQLRVSLSELFMSPAGYRRQWVPLRTCDVCLRCSLSACFRFSGFDSSMSWAVGEPALQRQFHVPFYVHLRSCAMGRLRCVFFFFFLNTRPLNAN